MPKKPAQNPTIVADQIAAIERVVFDCYERAPHFRQLDVSTLRRFIRTLPHELLITEAVHMRLATGGDRDQSRAWRTEVYFQFLDEAAADFLKPLTTEAPHVQQAVHQNP